MKLKNLLGIITGLMLIAGVSFFFYKKFTKPPQNIYSSKTPEVRDIYKIVNAEGELEAQGYARIGALITGTVKKIYVKEDQVVKKGDLLAELYNTTGDDTGVRQKKALLDFATATFEYTKAHYLRQQSLYLAQQLSKDNFEKETELYKQAAADIDNKQADYDHEVLLYSYTKIYSPTNGTILAIRVKDGETVSPFSSVPSVLFEIAQDLTTMKAELRIDENKIGDIKIGQVAKIEVDTYPNKLPWKGTIESVGHAPLLSQKQGGSVYKAIVMLSNDENLLLPGMTVHAKITIAKAKNVLSLPGLVFQIRGNVIQASAKILNYTYVPISTEEKKDLAKKRKLEKLRPPKYVWIVENNSFIERSVETGATDNSYFEILSGVGPNDQVIHDIQETDEMKKLYEMWFGKGL